MNNYFEWTRVHPHLYGRTLIEDHGEPTSLVIHFYPESDITIIYSLSWRDIQNAIAYYWIWKIFKGDKLDYGKNE